jgi:hypothetical protein
VNKNVTQAWMDEEEEQATDDILLLPSHTTDDHLQDDAKGLLQIGLG